MDCSKITGLALLALALGCSQPVEPKPAAAPGAVTAPTADAKSATGEAKPSAEEAVLASAKHPKKVIVEVTGIKRTGEWLEVSWQYRNPSDKSIKVFEGAPASGLAVLRKSIDFYVMLDNLKCVYAADGKTFQLKIAKSKTGSDLFAATVFRNGLTLQGKETSARCWARFAAPPDDVKKVSVFFADLEPLEDLPIAPAK